METKKNLGMEERPLGCEETAQSDSTAFKISDLLNTKKKKKKSVLLGSLSKQTSVKQQPAEPVLSQNENFVKNDESEPERSIHSEAVQNSNQLQAAPLTNDDSQSIGQSQASLFNPHTWNYEKSAAAMLPLNHNQGMGGQAMFLNLTRAMNLAQSGSQLNQNEQLSPNLDLFFYNQQPRAYQANSEPPKTVKIKIELQVNGLDISTIFQNQQIWVSDGSIRISSLFSQLQTLIQSKGLDKIYSLEDKAFWLFSYQSLSAGCYRVASYCQSNPFAQIPFSDLLEKNVLSLRLWQQEIFQERTSNFENEKSAEMTNPNDLSVMGPASSTSQFANFQEAPQDYKLGQCPPDFMPLNSKDYEASTRGVTFLQKSAGDRDQILFQNEVSYEQSQQLEERGFISEVMCDQSSIMMNDFYQKKGAFQIDQTEEAAQLEDSMIDQNMTVIQVQNYTDHPNDDSLQQIRRSIHK